jgi:phosphatidylglycerol---prolipoprotein diacylglyceryl transferase
MIPWFQYNVVQLGPLPIQVWGTFVALGMMVSLYIIKKKADAQKLNSEALLDLGFWMIISGVFFSRVFHVVFYEPQFFIQHPAELVKIWHGGLSSFGGVFGAGLAFYFLRKKYHVTKDIFWKVADIVGFSALFGWIIGRIGCVMIHDHMGKPCDCFLAIQTPDGPRLEMALLEILALLPLAIVFYVGRKTKKKEGWYARALFIYYGAIRFVLDFFRATDIAQADVRYFGLTPAQYAAIVLIAIGLYKPKK